MVDRHVEQMNPRLMLMRWRERWGKDDGRSAKTSNRKGVLATWGDWLTESLVWSWPGVAPVTLGLCVLLSTLVVLVPLSQNSQLVFSFLLICMALYARRNAGTFVTQLIFGLSFISSARYLFWRFSSTLGQNLDLDFVMGFCLCVAELYLCLLICIGYMQKLWPLKQASAILPSDPADWPTVDVFIPGHGRSYSSIESSAMAVLALDWPKKKIKTYILDDGYRDDINNLADSLGVSYKSFPDNLEDIAGSINLALADIKGELVAIFDGNELPDKCFLKASAGWFLSDFKLAMIYTPNHFLVPAPSKRSLRIFDATNLGGSGALIRRSMLLAVGGLSKGPVSKQAHTALKLQELGYIDAYIGFDRSEEAVDNKQMASIGMPGPSSLQVFRVDHPFWGDKMRWRQQLVNLQVMLQFYYTVPRLIFLAAPMAYLLLEANIIQASAGLFAAYALPHFLVGHLAQARMQDDMRFPVLVDIRETLLAWYMLFPTAITLVRTKIAHTARAFKEGRIKQDDPFDLVIAVPFVAIVFMNVAGLVIGIVRLLSSSNVDYEMSILYLLWAVYNLMILSAVLAVAEESRYILKYRRRQLRMPVMIKLPLGRSLYCMTVNFPEPSLVFALPTPIDVETGSDLHVSIFRGYREYLFSARVVSVDERSLRVDIEDSVQNEYRLLGVAVFSRGQDWPKWLPGRDADHPFPVWMINAFNVVYVAVLDFIRPLGESVLVTRFGGWIQIWKKRK
jgi:cellulose synthase (UDP-forming)